MCRFLNIGGISNVTVVGNYYPFDFTSRDIGPGNCLIDSWVRKNSNQKNVVNVVNKSLTQVQLPSSLRTCAP